MRPSIEHRKNSSSVRSVWTCSSGTNRDQPMPSAQEFPVTVPYLKSSTASGKKISRNETLQVKLDYAEDVLDALQ